MTPKLVHKVTRDYWLQRRAYMDGHAAGFARAQAETVRQALEAQTKARQFVDAAEEQIVTMALACVLRVAASLGPSSVVLALLTEALQEIRTGRRLQVRVSPGAVKATQEMLDRWQLEHPQVNVQVLVDEQLDPFDCEIESELGRIELGLRRQLQVLGQQIGPVTVAPVELSEVGPYQMSGQAL